MRERVYIIPILKQKNNIPRTYCHYHYHPTLFLRGLLFVTLCTIPKIKPNVSNDWKTKSDSDGLGKIKGLIMRAPNTMLVSLAVSFIYYSSSAS